VKSGLVARFANRLASNTLIQRSDRVEVALVARGQAALRARGRRKSCALAEPHDGLEADPRLVALRSDALDLAPEIRAERGDAAGAASVVLELGLESLLRDAEAAVWPKLPGRVDRAVVGADREVLADAVGLEVERLDRLRELDDRHVQRAGPELEPHCLGVRREPSGALRAERGDSSHRALDAFAASLAGFLGVFRVIGPSARGKQGEGRHGHRHEPDPD
jgi:hypothetical protein